MLCRRWGELSRTQCSWILQKKARPVGAEERRQLLCIQKTRTALPILTSPVATPGGSKWTPCRSRARLPSANSAFKQPLLPSTAPLQLATRPPLPRAHSTILPCDARLKPLQPRIVICSDLRSTYLPFTCYLPLSPKHFPKSLARTPPRLFVHFRTTLLILTAHKLPRLQNLPEKHRDALLALAQRRATTPKSCTCSTVCRIATL
jgi:hypothetical protein